MSNRTERLEKKTLFMRIEEVESITKKNVVNSILDTDHPITSCFISSWMQR